VIRAPELIASAGEWERLAEGERFDGDGTVSETGEEVPDWAK
jgi:hypothetical protein